MLQHTGIPKTTLAARPPPFPAQPTVHAPLPALTSPQHRPLLPGTTGHAGKHQGRHEKSRARGGRRAIPPRCRRPVGPALLSPASPPTADTCLTSPPLPAATPPRPTLYPQIKGKLNRGANRRFLPRGCTPSEHPEASRGAEVGASMARGAAAGSRGPRGSRVPALPTLTHAREATGSTRSITPRSRTPRSHARKNDGRASNMTSGKKTALLPLIGCGDDTPSSLSLPLGFSPPDALGIPKGCGRRDHLSYGQRG